MVVLKTQLCTAQSTGLKVHKNLDQTTVDAYIPEHFWREGYLSIVYTRGREPMAHEPDVALLMTASGSQESNFLELPVLHCI